MEKNDQEIARLEHRQEQLDHQMTREKNTLAYLSAKERKARTHRLIQKGGVIEHHAPETMSSWKRSSRSRRQND